MKPPRRVRFLPSAAAIGLIRLYQWVVSPILPRSCRFAPSCSEYAAEAVGRHGLIAGGLLGLRRILRCHPWGGDGYDPVPDHPWRHLRGARHPQHPSSCPHGTQSHPHLSR